MTNNPTPNEEDKQSSVETVASDIQPLQEETVKVDSVNHREVEEVAEQLSEEIETVADELGEVESNLNEELKEVETWKTNIESMMQKSAQALTESQNQLTQLAALTTQLAQTMRQLTPQPSLEKEDDQQEAGNPNPPELETASETPPKASPKEKVQAKQESRKVARRWM